MEYLENLSATQLVDLDLIEWTFKTLEAGNRQRLKTLDLEYEVKLCQPLWSKKRFWSMLSYGMKTRGLAVG